MKLLLDENLPRRLGSKIAHHTVLRVGQMGWQGKKNGQLMALMLENEFEGLITMDKGIPHQQNFLKYPITIYVLEAKSNTLADLLPLLNNLMDALSKIHKPGAVLIKL
jgi:hypothetical protein